jgi:ribosomal protein S18 acetylase RimI-like enzyme
MLTLRRTTEADKDTLADMYMIDFEDNYIHAALFANEIVENQKTILCFQENKLAGLSCWGVRGLLENGVCEINHLFVRPNFRRKHAGTKLVDKTIKIAEQHYDERGFELRLLFSFSKKNDRITKSFFKSIDFIPTSEIGSFYPNDDAVIWIKRIRNEM